MKTLLACLSLSVCAGGAFAQTKVTTLVAKGYVSVTNGQSVALVPHSATFAVPSTEAAKVISLMASQGGGAQVTVQKDGVICDASTCVIQGPAVFTVSFIEQTGHSPADGAILTLERWRVARVPPVR